MANKNSLQNKTFLKHSASLQMYLNVDVVARTTLSGHLVAGGWLMPGAADDAVSLKNIMATKILLQAAKYDELIDMLEQVTGIESILADMLADCPKGAQDGSSQQTSAPPIDKPNVEKADSGQKEKADAGLKEKFTTLKEKFTTPSKNVREETDAGIYKMTSKCRGIALIINNKEFEHLEDREGTNKDAVDLKELFDSLGFEKERQPLENLTAGDMRAKLKELAEADHTAFDCVVVAILTHGTEGKWFGTDGKNPRSGFPKNYVSVEEVAGMFYENTTLSNKPKVFIVQACRGRNIVEADSGDGDCDWEASKNNEEKAYMSALAGARKDVADGGHEDSIPPKPHFLFAYSSFQGYVSMRNTIQGSWYIQAFVRQMKKSAKTKDLKSILTDVRRDVYENYHEAQMTDPRDTLLKQLYFRPI